MLWFSTFSLMKKSRKNQDHLLTTTVTAKGAYFCSVALAPVVRRTEEKNKFR